MRAIDLERAVGRDYASKEQPLTMPKVKRPGAYKPADYVAHIRFAGGIAAAAARNMGITRSSVSMAAARHLEVQEALEEERAMLGDLLEQRIFRKAMGTPEDPDGNTQVQMFLLQTIFRDRGYVQRNEISLTDEMKDPMDMTPEELLEAERMILAGMRR